MSHSNANFRNTGTGLNYSLAANPGRAYVDVRHGALVVDPTLALECGNIYSSSTFKGSRKSYYRTASLAQNQMYHAKLCTLQVDDPGPVDITVVANGFTPYITMVRNENYRWSSSEGGVLAVTLEDVQTGPMTVEVTSVEPFLFGEFTIQVSCASTSDFNLSLTTCADGFSPFTLIAESTNTSEWVWEVEIPSTGWHYLPYVDGVSSQITLFGSVVADVTLSVRGVCDAVVGYVTKTILIPYKPVSSTLHAAGIAFWGVTIEGDLPQTEFTQGVWEGNITTVESIYYLYMRLSMASSAELTLGYPLELTTYIEPGHTPQGIYSKAGCHWPVGTWVLATNLVPLEPPNFQPSATIVLTEV